eukprot:TRINITY_DN44704_c0_g1_i1.p1 TRINITY_DN44704_c0_g1~~TRINITY_DN44704_c0_g1_i1.p1  ORF type:complete len:128 (+),score=9.64 TRINITY_DN44704_c0_g1_i1:72-455(+)
MGQSGMTGLCHCQERCLMDGVCNESEQEDIAVPPADLVPQVAVLPPVLSRPCPSAPSLEQRDQVGTPFCVANGFRSPTLLADWKQPVADARGKSPPSHISPQEGASAGVDLGAIQPRCLSRALDDRA